MKKIFKMGLPLIAVAIFSMAMLASCNHNMGGRMYRPDSNFNKTLEFLADNTVIIDQNSVASYRVTSNIIIVNNGGTTSIYRILNKTTAKTLLDENGKRWTKI